MCHVRWTVSGVSCLVESQAVSCLVNILRVCHVWWTVSGGVISGGQSQAVSCLVDHVC